MLGNKFRKSNKLNRSSSTGQASPKIDLIFEDKNLIAVNKPAGLLTHPIGGKNEGKEATLTQEILKIYPEIAKVGDPSAHAYRQASGRQAIQERPGLVHRLDKETSGILVIAKNQKTFEYLKRLFGNHEIKKTYLALAHGKFKEKRGIIDKPISLKPNTTRRTTNKGKMAKEALTEYEVLKTFDFGNDSATFSLLKVSPKTGRTHQIRVHLASINHPIVGDTMYGKKTNPFGLTRQFLHAKSLEFNLENGKRIKLEADLPNELKKVILDLEKNETGNTK